MGTVLSSNLKNTALVYYRERLQSSCKEKSKARPCSDLLSVKSVSESISMFARSLSHVWLVVTAWTIAHRLLCPWDFPGKNTGVGCHFSGGSSRPRDQTCISCIGRHILHPCAPWEGPGNSIGSAPGAPWVRYRRVVWGLYKGVTEPLPCCSQGFQLLLTKIPSQTQRECPGLRNVRGQLDTLRTLPSGTLLPSASQLHSGQLQEGYPHWEDGGKVSSLLGNLNRRDFFLLLLVYQDQHTWTSLCPRNGPCPNPVPRRGAGTIKRGWRGDWWSKAIAPFSSIPGCQLGSTAISLKASYTKSWQKKWCPVEEIKDNLFWYLLKQWGRLCSRLLQ